jgi:hypothetical protein
LGCLLFWLGVIAVPVGTAAPTRAGGGGVAVYGLSLDGQSMGMLKSVSGTTALAPIPTAPTASVPTMKSSTVKGSSDVTALELGFGMSPAVYDWIGQALANQSKPRKVAIIQYDATLNAVGQRAYDTAAISEVAFPACDATSSAPGSLTVKLQGAPAPEAALPKVAAATGKNAPWPVSQFKLDIDGLDCTRVIKVEGLTFKQRISTAGAPFGPVAVSSFKVTLPEATAQSWHKWFEDFMVNGKNTTADHKRGRLSFLAANGNELAALQLSEIGPKTLRALTSSGQAAPKIEMELYFANATLSVGGGK